MPSERGRCVVLGVTGGIAAYKACELLRLLQKAGCDVWVVMTENAARFVAPLTFETLSGHPAVSDTFVRPATWEVEHIALAKRADLFVIAPATANILAKMAAGLADDMLSTTVLATKAPVLVAPAMNTGMLTNTATQENIRLLSGRGVHFVQPATGHLACGDEGAGRMADVADIAAAALRLLDAQRDLEGVRVTVTAGPTREAIDPVRYLSNRSSGRMGYALAETAARRGAEVTLLSGPVSLQAPAGVRVIPFLTTEDLLREALRVVPETDVLIQAAAPGDFRAEQAADQKIKKDGSGRLTLHLIENPDVAATLGRAKRDGQFFAGFAAETQNLLENARKKLQGKHLDMIVANDVTRPGAGFDVETNIVTIITPGGIQELPLMTKTQAADMILDAIIAARKAQED